MINDNVTHIEGPKPAHQERSVHLDKFWVTQSTLDGLCVLIHWLDALEKFGKQGDIPGRFELVMHYRNLSSAVRKVVE